MTRKLVEIVFFYFVKSVTTNDIARYYVSVYKTFLQTHEEVQTPLGVFSTEVALSKLKTVANSSSFFYNSKGLRTFFPIHNNLAACEITQQLFGEKNKKTPYF